jgi:hypothetical protein
MRKAGDIGAKAIELATFDVTRDEWMRAVRRGDYPNAWRINESIQAARDPATRDDPSAPYHCRWVWDGSPLEGRKILVRCYHGLGDTLQFARYLSPLRSIAASVTVEVQPELLPLLNSVPGIDRLVPFVRETPMPPFECNIEIMELPFALKIPPEKLSSAYLQSNAALLPQGTIGVCWEAGDWDPERSIPCDMVAALISGPWLTFQTSPTELPVLNRQGCPRDMAITASLAAGTALIITVDTMIAHLAGALGRPTWLLLKHDADWRWMAGGTCSPWYPSMRLFRQPVPGDWNSVIAAVAEELAAGGGRPASRHSGFSPLWNGSV